MAFKTQAQVQAETEARIAAAQPYTVRDADQAKRLLLHTRRGKGVLEVKDRLEKTRRHLAANPNDIAAQAGYAVANASLHAFADDVVENAMKILTAG